MGRGRFYGAPLLHSPGVGLLLSLLRPVIVQQDYSLPAERLITQYLGSYSPFTGLGSV